MSGLIILIPNPAIFFFFLLKNPFFDFFFFFVKLHFTIVAFMGHVRIWSSIHLV